MKASPLVALPPWQSLTLREQVGQLLAVHLTKHVSPAPDLAEFFARHPVGAIFCGGEVIEDGTNRFEHIAATVARCQAISKVPLLIAADLENGGGDVIPGLTPLPWPMALGAANDEALAREYGAATADEGALAGINWALAPMADLNLHPLSANVGTRAFGDHPDRVLPLTRAFVAGLQSRGMAACAKTFPGDGSDYRDQHLVTTMNQLSREDWWASYGKVFQGLVDAGVMSIMTGHFSLPSMQTPRGDGSYDPCTVSRELVTGVLKERMGYRGVVITDAMGMAGILTRRNDVEGAVEAFATGTDMVLWPGLEFIDRVVEELEAGRIPMSRLHDALDRIWRMKAACCAPPAAAPNPAAARERAEAVAERTAAAALTLLWNRGDRLPLRPERDRRVLLVGITPHDKAYDRLEILAEELRRRGFTVEKRRHTTPAWVRENSARFDVIIAAVERQFHRSLGPMEIHGEDARNFWSLATQGPKLVAVGLGSPYLVPWYLEHAGAALNAYSAVPASQRAVARALCGEIAPSGSSPVRWARRFGVVDLTAWR